ncbi:uncharacterized protein LOC123689153 [Pieris rapae]|nr:uncharacterized protein LOC123689153 [Pieris rapae]
MDAEDAPTISPDKSMPADECGESNEIDVEILGAMGTVEEELAVGPTIHTEIAQRWTPVLTKGLKKEDKASLLKNYVAFSNVPAMVPPKLNPELLHALTDPVKKRDVIIELRQKNISAALAAIGLGLHCFLTKGDKVEGIKNINDAARILCDVIYTETIGRRGLIQGVVNKQMKDSLQASPDELLFGNGLTERIKTTKAVQKSAQDLTRTNQSPRPCMKNQKALNSRAPPQHKPRNKENQFHVRGGKKMTQTPQVKKPGPLQRRYPTYNNHPGRK